MPLHDVGYRSWGGDKSPALGRWWTVASTGVRLAFRSSWLSRMLILSWVPAIIAGAWFFLFEQSIVNVQYRQLVRPIVLASGASSQLALSVLTDPADARHEVWASMLLVFFRYPQCVLMLIVVGLVAPRLISADLRNRGYLLYFSRPLNLWEYMLGKAFIIWTFLALITTLPALLLYFVGLCLSPDMTVLWSTWDLPIRIVAASIVLMVPVSVVALACSAMTVETRYAAFNWFAIWVVGWVSFSVLRLGEAAVLRRDGPRFGRSFRNRGRFPDENATDLIAPSNWELLSPFHVLGRVQQYVFGLYPDDQAITAYVGILVTVSLVSVWFIRRRVLSRFQA